jgi:MoaA/NifB/PqqE/SkfB family radical SAM enzyme
MISVSIDAATAATYKEIRGKDKFDIVCSNIAKIAACKKAKGKKRPVVRASFVITKINMQEMKTFIDTAKDLQISSIYFQPLDLYFRTFMHHQLVGEMKKEEFIAQVTNANVYAHLKRITTNLDEILSNVESNWKKYELKPQSDKRKCILPWFSVYITVDGIMRPCCSLFAEGDMGDLNLKSCAEVWNSTEYQELRKQFKRCNLFFTGCATCVPLGGLGDIWKNRLKHTFGLKPFARHK